MCFLFHASETKFFQGAYGVTGFFTLSGFLIARNVFLADVSRPFSASLRFYVRRALRLLPAFLITCFILLFFSRLSYPWYTLTYTFNFKLFFLTLNQSNPETVEFLRHWKTSTIHFWTLCVEEQFYLFMPIFIFFLRSRHARLSAILFGIVLTLVARFVLRQQAPDSFYGALPIGASESILWGSLVAHFNAPSPKKISANYSWIFLLALIAILIGQSYFAEEKLLEFRPNWLHTPISLCYAGLIWSCFTNPDKGFALVLRNSVLAHLGVISYSLYLLHMPILGFLTEEYSSSLSISYVSKVVATLFFTILFAEIYWRTFEGPIYRLKRFFPMK